MAEDRPEADARRTPGTPGSPPGEATGLSPAEREARLAAILEGAPVGIVLLDADTFTVREASPTYYEFLEGEWRRPGSIVGRRFDEFIPAFEESGTAALFRRARDTGEPVEVPEHEFGGFERGTTYFRWTLTPLRGATGGSPRYLLLLVVEITEQVVARRLVEAERRALYDVLDGLPVGVVVAEAPAGKIVYLNPAAVELGGREPRELAAEEIGEYVARWRIFTPVGDRFPTEEVPMARALRGESVREIEMVLELPDGTRRTVLVNGGPLRDAAGKLTRAVVAFYDVTDRLLLEQALLERTQEAEEAAGNASLRAEESRALREMSRALVSVLEPDHVLRLAAAHAMELLNAAGGVIATPDAVGETLRFGPAVGIFAPLDGRSFPLRGTVAERVIEESRTLVFNSLDDFPPDSPVLPSIRELGVRSAVFAPVRAYGEQLGVLAVVNRRDAFSSEHARLMEALADSAALAVRNARMYEAAQEASRAKSDFLAMMSHELRTPLNALEGYSALLEDGIYGPLNDAQRGALERMRASRRHLMALIEQVLDMARVEAGRKRVEVEPTELRPLVLEVVDALRGAAERKGLTLEVEADGVGRVVTDPGMVRQILTNLVGNAIKFTDRGGIRVQGSGDEERAWVEVTDTGPGISPEHQERIFESFYQVDASRTRREGGSGLGLALSREFARLLGGELSVRSEPGRGSTFELVLPRHPRAPGRGAAG